MKEFKIERDRGLAELKAQHDSAIQQHAAQTSEEERRLRHDVASAQNDAQLWEKTTHEYVAGIVEFKTQLSVALKIKDPGPELQDEDGHWHRYRTSYRALLDRVQWLMQTRVELQDALLKELNEVGRLMTQLKESQDRLIEYEMTLKQLVDIKLDDA